MFGKKPYGAALAPQTEPALSRWGPWDEMAELRRQIDGLFSKSFGYTPVSQLLSGAEFAFEPAVDIYTTDDSVYVYAALPGFALDAIEVEATADALTIFGERKASHDTDKAVPEQKNGVVGESKFRVQCTLPAEIDPNRVKASLRDGVLELVMPKTDQARTKAVKVPISAA